MSPRSRLIALRVGAVAGALIILLIGGLGLWWRGRPERHLTEAVRLLDRGEHEEARGWLAVPESDRATRDRALLLHARIAVEQGRPAEAAETLNRVDPHGPWATDADFWKGRALYAARNPGQAIDWFRRVLERRPDDVDARRWLAAIAYDLGDWLTAVDALKTVTRLRPDDARAWRTLGLLYKEENERERAQAAYESSLKHDPHQPRVRLELAEILLRRGLHAEAEAQLNLCRGEVPEAEWFDLLVQCLLATGETARARTQLEAALAAHPEHAGLLAQRASIAQAEGQTSEAVRWLDLALERDPYNAPWFYRRGRLLRSLGKTAESDRDLARADELNRAMSELTELNHQATTHPDDPSVRTQLAHLCVRLGKTELAAYWYRAALACDPAFAPARLGLHALSAR